MARRRSTVRGAGKLRRVLLGLPDVALQEVQKEIKESAEVVHFEALQNIPKPGMNPYATGDLVAKFRIDISKDGLRARVGSFGGKNQRAAHIHLVEFGTAAGMRKGKDGQVYWHPGTPAQPFLFPAYKQHRAENVKRIRSAIARALNIAARGAGGGDPL